ncbi:MAG: SURF1 family protein [Chloroflexi bacterium]|nr:SURF1 family protein [Chloroflexota bacterium]
MRRLQTPALLALIVAALVVLTGLGTWQLARNEWKQGLVEDRDAAIAAAPLAAAEAATLDGEAIEYRRVALEGEWDYGSAQIVANRTRFGLRGEDVYVPLRTGDGSPALLVRRGWYPADERDRVLASLKAGAPSEGLALRASSTDSRRNEDGAWTRFSLDSIAAALPYPVAPLYVIAGERVEQPPRQVPDELPVTGYAGYRNTTPHIEYALTWYGLAVVLAITVAVRIRQQRRGREAGPAGGGSTSDAPPA